jgi:hypothetical protein
MADAAPTGRSKWLWIIVIIALLALLIIWLADPSGDADEAVAVAPEVEATDFVEAPTDPAVPVTLPDTPMTNAPPSPAQ